MQAAWQQHLGGTALVLLYAYWILATGAVLAVVLDLPVGKAFKQAVVLSAARGKLWETRPKDLKAFQNLDVPHSYFSHFYAVGVAACLPLIVYTTRPPPVLYALLLHLVRRFAESVALFHYPPGAKMHLLAYIFGLSYYVVLPATFAFGPLLMLLTTFLPAVPSEPFDWLRTAASWTDNKTTTIALVMGAFWFLMGTQLQLQAHRQLAKLSKATARETAAAVREAAPKGSQTASAASAPQKRKSVTPSTAGSGSTGVDSVATGEAYGLPQGGVFSGLWCPHYLGEIIIYAGFQGLALGQPAPPGASTLAILPFIWVVGVFGKDL